jgi:hypothetical protein
MTPEDFFYLKELAFCTDCKQDVICHRKGCRGKFLNHDGSWKKPYITSLDKGGIYFDNKSLKL